MIASSLFTMPRVFGTLPREMNPEMRDIEKEGFVVVLLDEFNTVFGNQVRGVTFLV